MKEFWVKRTETVSRRIWGFRVVLLLQLVAGFGTFSLMGQSNIIYNGSFEFITNGVPFDGWNWVNMGGRVNELGGADGRSWAIVGSVGSSFISQNLQTVSGRDYVLRFAVQQNNNRMRIRVNEATLTELDFTGVSSTSWKYTNFLFTATSNLTSLKFEGVAGNSPLDALSAGWAAEPPSVITQPFSRSSFEGGAVSFVVKASGAPILFYQWRFLTQPIAGATNPTLTLANVTSQNEGEYDVVITNVFGTVSSLPAKFFVYPLPKSPVILSYPKSQSTISQYFVGFSVVAFGTPPLAYQWFFNGTNLIAGATNATYTINSVDPTNDGQYTVLITNGFGSTVSFPVTLNVSPSNGLAAVIFENKDTAQRIDAPVFDLDGITRLVGSTFAAQLYSGSSSNSLHPVGLPRSFQSGTLAGYFFSSTRYVYDGLPGQTVYVQVRAWDKTAGQTYEEAQIRGGKFGKSDVIPITVYNGPPELAPPTFLNGLWSFSLQAGQPLYATAQFRFGDLLPDGQREWVLVGDAGWVYLVEQQLPPADWVPFIFLTNVTGTVSFIDPTDQSANAKFYRARILLP